MQKIIMVESLEKEGEQRQKGQGKFLPVPDPAASVGSDPDLGADVVPDPDPATAVGPDPNQVAAVVPESDPSGGRCPGRGFCVDNHFPIPVCARAQD